MVWTGSMASCFSQSLFSLKDRARPPCSRRRENPRPPRLGPAGEVGSPVCLSPFLGSHSGPLHGFQWTNGLSLSPIGLALCVEEATVSHGCTWHPLELCRVAAAQRSHSPLCFFSPSRGGPGLWGQGPPGRFCLPGSDCGRKYPPSNLVFCQWGWGLPCLPWVGGRLIQGLAEHRALLCASVPRSLLCTSRHQALF